MCAARRFVPNPSSRESGGDFRVERWQTLVSGSGAA
jgi:hypothetical protein